MAMRRWPLYSVVFVLDGRARYENEDGFIADLGPGNLVLMFPGHGYRYIVDPDLPWSEIYLQFAGPAFDLWRDAGVISRAHPVLALDPIAWWKARFAGLLEPGRRARDDLRRVVALQGILLDAVASAPREAESADAAWLRSAVAELRRELPTADWAAAAGRLALSADHFRKRFRRLAGESPRRHLERLRLAEAAALLRQGLLGCAAIAERLGFADVYHFSKRFKRAVGVPPRDYRRAAGGGITAS